MKPKRSNIIEFEGLGTIWSVELLGYNDFPADLADFVRSTVKLFDDTYSRFKEESLIGQLNIHKKLVQPPKELLELFVFAHKMHTATNGAFDISVGGTLQRLGYGNTRTARAAYPGFWDEAKFDEKEIVIPDKSAIDFGGFGKGWLLDKLAVLLEQRGYPHYIINGGGDIVLNSPMPIELGLEHPYDPSKVIGTTKITQGALAVSSTVKRRWLHNGTTENHIVDPFKDSSTDSTVVSTYVRGKTALIADTLATVLVLRPDLKAQLERRFDVEVIIVTQNQVTQSQTLG